VNPLTDDPLDTELRAALHGIEGRSPLSVDVDTVIARGRSRRRAVVAERVLAVVAVLAVVLGATVFAVRSSSDRDLVVGPVPPTGTPTGATNPLALIVDLNGEYAETATPRTGSTALLLSNQTGKPITITGWSLKDAPPSARANIAAPITSGEQESLTAAGRRALLSAPRLTTVEMAARQEVNLLVALTASCTAADATIRPSIVLDLRAADGTTSQQVIAPTDFAQGPAGLSWVDWAILKACGKLPYPVARPTSGPGPSASTAPTSSSTPSRSGAPTPSATTAASGIDSSLPSFLRWANTETMSDGPSRAALTPYGLKNPTPGPVTSRPGMSSTPRDRPRPASSGRSRRTSTRTSSPTRSTRSWLPRR
jgi:hypothetical protein